MKQIDFTRSMMHDSARETYRNPLGAVRGGETVTLKVRLRDFTYEKAFLTVLRGAYKVEIEMHRDGDMLFCEYDTPSKPQVVWYWFSFRMAENEWMYYGAPPGYTSGVGRLYQNIPPAYQLTVYDRDFKTPDWFKNANLYQIFPDRFKRGKPEHLEIGAAYHRGKGRDVIVHEDWSEEPLYQPISGRRFYQPCDYYGGDLIGIEQQLDYLQNLGVTAVYLNPIFEAASNHRYNTGDYLNIDPILGDLKDFKQLAQKAGEKGIKLILDGVFSHTGDDSVYFNRYGRYDSTGAYQSQASPYYTWYLFSNYPNQYKSWWGFETLPEVDENQEDWRDFIIKNDDSVIRTWLKRGASGFRLDVADELPDSVIEDIRTALKDESQENVLIGEVWEDATIKQSYGVNRTYALGRGLDSVMNYPFCNATIDFLLGNIDAPNYKRFLINQSQNYPQDMYYALMNLLSSHDITRARTRLSIHNDGKSLSRDQQAHFVITEDQDRWGATLLRMAAAIQFSLPGAPSIYYGDESGMNGMMDPFNRKPFVITDEEMMRYYSKLAHIRLEHVALRLGYFAYFSQSADELAILRLTTEGHDAFGDPADEEMIITVVNRSPEAHNIVIDLFAPHQALPDSHLNFFHKVDLTKGVSLLSGTSIPVSEGLISVETPGHTADIIQIIWE